MPLASMGIEKIVKRMLPAHANGEHFIAIEDVHVVPEPMDGNS
jgi:hypothetical protein